MEYRSDLYKMIRVYIIHNSYLYNIGKNAAVMPRDKDSFIIICNTKDDEEPRIEYTSDMAILSKIPNIIQL